MNLNTDINKSLFVKNVDQNTQKSRMYTLESNKQYMILLSSYVYKISKEIYYLMSE